MKTTTRMEFSIEQHGASGLWTYGPLVFRGAWRSAGFGTEADARTAFEAELAQARAADTELGLPLREWVVTRVRGAGL